MQVKKIAALCALACTAMAGSAHAALSAAAIADLNAANTGSRVIFISGASAVQKGFTDIIARTFVPASINYYSDGAAVSSANYAAVSGTLEANTGAWAGQKAIIIYRVKGGSVFGVNPVAKSGTDSLIQSMLVNKDNCGSTGSGTSAAPYKCIVDDNAPYTMAPDAGVSDVAPQFFKNPVNTEGEIPADELTPDQLAELTSIPLYGMAFGIPVTNTVNSNAVFNRATVAAIMTNNIGTWNMVKGVPSTDTDDIVICRRVPGSGTQAVMNMWAGSYPCGGIANIPADRDSSAGAVWDATARKFTVNKNSGGLTVIENSTSGQVRDCLNKAVTGGSYPTFDRDGLPATVEFVGAGHKAIGVLSMDSLKDSKTAGNWQFRSLDGAGKIVQDTAGAAPTTTGTGKFPLFDTYESGDWDLQGWISFNLPTRTTGAKKQVLDRFVVNAKEPGDALAVPPVKGLQTIADLKYVAAGLPLEYNGVTPSGAYTLDAVYLNGDQCAPYNRNSND